MSISISSVTQLYLHLIQMNHTIVTVIKINLFLLPAHTRRVDLGRFGLLDQVGQKWEHWDIQGDSYSSSSSNCNEFILLCFSGSKYCSWIITASSDSVPCNEFGWVARGRECWGTTKKDQRFDKQSEEILKLKRLKSDCCWKHKTCAR